MIGYPKYINTRQDIDHLMSYLGTPYDTPKLRAHGISHLQGLLDTAKHYVFDKVLAIDEAPSGPEPDYVVRDTTLPDGITEQHQFVLVDKPDAQLYRLGYTLADVELLISKLGE